MFEVFHDEFTRTDDPEPPIEWWRVVLLFVSVAVIVWWVHCLVQPARAEGSGFLAVTLVCPAGTAGSECSRDNAMDMAVQPVAMVTDCQAVGQVLATRLSLAPGEFHKVACERRKG